MVYLLRRIASVPYLCRTLNHKAMYTVETITPELASQYLSNQSANRPINPQRVKLLAYSIRDGEWKSKTGQPIKFDQAGRLIDGQHRLTAVVRAGCTVDMEVVRGLDSNVFIVLDTGMSRSTSDVVLAGGLLKGDKKLISALSMAISHYITTLNGLGLCEVAKVSLAQRMTFIEANPDLCQQALDMIGFSPKDLRGMVAKDSSYIRIYIEMHFQGGNVSRLVEYFACLVNGVSLNEYQTKVRNLLIQTRSGTWRSHYELSFAQFNLLRIGWNGYVSGKSDGRLPALTKTYVLDNGNLF